jgi:hypothetical protein
VNNMVMLLVVVLAIVALVALVAWATQRRRSDQLRRRFGPEYERTVGAARDKREAEAELRARQERVDALEIRPLDRAARDRYVDRWREVQAMFVDDPGNAVDQADRLIGEVMRARGYPVGDFEQRAADVSVNHPHVVDHYRTAHGIAVRRRTGDGATEELRQAFVHYRALFADLLEVSDSNSAKAPAEARAAEPPDGTSHGATAEDAPTEASTAAPRTPAPDTTTTAEADTPAETRRTR